MVSWENSHVRNRRLKARQDRLNSHAESMLACLKRAETATALVIDIAPEGPGKLHLLAMHTDLKVNIKRIGL